MELPSRCLLDTELNEIARRLKIPNFKGTLMSDEVESVPSSGDQCAIVNLESSEQNGSHWVTFSRLGSKRTYFDSYGQQPPVEILKQLKTKKEHAQNLPAVKCNYLVVQKDGTTECGALCIYVLQKLSRGHPFDEIIHTLHDRYLLPRPTPLIIQ